MDISEALRFITFHERRQESKEAQERAEQRALQKSFLEQEKFDLQERKFGLQERKFGLDFAKEMQRVKEGEVEQEKGVISSLIGSYHKGNFAEKNAVAETMKGYYHTLDQYSKAKLDPYVQYGSPMSDMAVKGKEFDLTHPMPIAPTAEEFEKNPYLGAQHLFNLEDRKHQREMATVGHATKKRDLIMIDKDFGAYRGEDGVAQLLNNEDMKLHSIASKSGMSLAELYANNGKKREEEPSSYMVEGGQLVGVYRENNYITNTSTHVSKRIGDARDTEVDIPKDVRELLQDITFNNEENSTAMLLRDMLQQGERERGQVIENLKRRTSHLSFKLNKLKELSWLDEQLLGARHPKSLYFWKPVKTAEYKKEKREKEGFGLTIIQGDETPIEIPGYGWKKFYMVPEGTIRNSDNQIIGHTRERGEFLKRIEREFDAIPSIRKDKKEK